jgi:DNA-binding transcriptional regulator YdaS (Cro superfamily)
MSDLDSTKREAIERAIGAAGGASNLAKGINQVTGLPLPATTPKSKNHVSTWRRRGAAPADMAIRIEAATKGQVTRHELSPDVFGFEPIDPPATGEAAP